MGFKPVQDHYLLKFVEPEPDKVGLIYVPGNRDENIVRGEVILFGPEANFLIEKGATVVFSELAACFVIFINGEKHFIIEEKDILGVVTS